MLETTYIEITVFCAKPYNLGKLKTFTIFLPDWATCLHKIVKLIPALTLIILPTTVKLSLLVSKLFVLELLNCDEALTLAVVAC